MNRIYSTSGDSNHRNIGDQLVMHMETLEPSGIPIYYIYYSNMRYESERISYFFNGLITLVELEKTVTTTSTKVEPIKDSSGKLKLDKVTG